MLLLAVKHKLFHLDGSDIVDFIVALRMFTRSLILKRSVENLQCGVESYHKKLNIAKPHKTFLEIDFKEPYSPSYEPPGIELSKTGQKEISTRLWSGLQPGDAKEKVDVSHGISSGLNSGKSKHKREYDRMMQSKEGNVNSRKALDVGLVVMESIETESGWHVLSSRSGNDTHIDDADINSVNDKQPMAETKDHADSLIVQLNCKLVENADLKAQIQEKVFANAALKNELRKIKGTIKFGNDHVAKILGYGDYQIENVMISRVYYIEGLGHNLFSVGKFCDSNLEVAFRQHTCFIRNLEVPVQQIRTDNGTKFVNQTLREYYEKVDISHETSIARSPQQNGVVERRNRTLIKAARTMLIYAKAPLFLWAEAVATAYFDELTAMASEHSSLEPALHEITPTIISSRLVPNPPPSTPFVPPSRSNWDILFQPLFDELLNPPSSVDRPAPNVIAPIAEVVVPEPAASTGPLNMNNITFGMMDAKRSWKPSELGLDVIANSKKMRNSLQPLTSSTNVPEKEVLAGFADEVENSTEVKEINQALNGNISSNEKRKWVTYYEKKMAREAEIKRVVNTGTSQTPNTNASEEKDKNVELIVVPSSVKILKEKDGNQGNLPTFKDREDLERPSQEEEEEPKRLLKLYRMTVGSSHARRTVTVQATTSMVGSYISPHGMNVIWYQVVTERQNKREYKEVWFFDRNKAEIGGPRASKDEEVLCLTTSCFVDPAHAKREAKIQEGQKVIRHLLIEKETKRISAGSSVDVEDINLFGSDSLPTSLEQVEAEILNKIDLVNVKSCNNIPSRPKYNSKRLLNLNDGQENLSSNSRQTKLGYGILGYTIIEASIRNTLQLADATGITMLPNDEIFEGMSSKSDGWDQFGSNIATALICLSTGQAHDDVTQTQPSSSTPIHASIPTPTPIPDTEPEPFEHTFEEPSPVHQHFSPPQE
ncbi:retrovirus-related pol polyprotein from transposon TNT 1-94, partial [Tanacetum coccineum]